MSDSKSVKSSISKKTNKDPIFEELNDIVKNRLVIILTLANERAKNLSDPTRISESDYYKNQIISILKQVPDWDESDLDYEIDSCLQKSIYNLDRNGTYEFLKKLFTELSEKYIDNIDIFVPTADSNQTTNNRKIRREIFQNVYNKLKLELIKNNETKSTNENDKYPDQSKSILNPQSYINTLMSTKGGGESINKQNKSQEEDHHQTDSISEPEPPQPQGEIIEISDDETQNGGRTKNYPISKSNTSTKLTPKDVEDYIAFKEFLKEIKSKDNNDKSFKDTIKETIKDLKNIVKQTETMKEKYNKSNKNQKGGKNNLPYFNDNSNEEDEPYLIKFDEPMEF